MNSTSFGLATLVVMVLLGIGVAVLAVKIFGEGATAAWVGGGVATVVIVWFLMGLQNATKK